MPDSAHKPREPQPSDPRRSRIISDALLGLAGFCLLVSTAQAQPQRLGTYIDTSTRPAVRPAAAQEEIYTPPARVGDVEILEEPFDFAVPTQSKGMAPPAHCRWIRGEYLLWTVDGFSTPALVTTSTPGTARDVAGLLGQPTTTVLFGNADLTDQIRPGGRINVGTWFDSCAASGVEATFWALADRNTFASFDSTAFPILARPFFNVEPGFEGQDAELAAFPGELEGNISVAAQTRMHGAEILYRHALSRLPHRVDYLVGYRYTQLDDDLLITDFKRTLTGGGGLAVGTTLSEFDRFQTENQFHGAELGVVTELRHCNWTLELLTKVAVGNTHSRVAIDGSTTVTVPVPGGPADVVTTPSGLLAQQTNIGIYEQNNFSMIPELTLTAGYNVTHNLRAMIGYTFIYWSRVARAGDQIDTDLNLSQLAPGGLNGISRPEFPGVVTDVWVQGLNLSLEYRF